MGRETDSTRGGEIGRSHKPVRVEFQLDLVLPVQLLLGNRIGNHSDQVGSQYVGCNNLVLDQLLGGVFVGDNHQFRDTPLRLRGGPADDGIGSGLRGGIVLVPVCDLGESPVHDAVLATKVGIAVHILRAHLYLVVHQGARALNGARDVGCCGRDRKGRSHGELEL